jgi:hypothetical protein
VLISQSRFVASMLAAPDGDIDLMTLADRPTPASPPQGLIIAQYSAADGRLQRIIYRHDYASATAYGYIYSSSIATDPSGRYLLLSVALDHCEGNTCNSGYTTVGWIEGGSVRPLTSFANWLSVTGW